MTITLRHWSLVFHKGGFLTLNRLGENCCCSQQSADCWSSARWARGQVGMPGRQIGIFRISFRHASASGCLPSQKNQVCCCYDARIPVLSRKKMRGQVYMYQLAGWGRGLPYPNFLFDYPVTPLILRDELSGLVKQKSPWLYPTRTRLLSLMT